MSSKFAKQSTKAVLALAFAFTAAPLASAQQTFSLRLPQTEDGREPLAYMRPHYLIHQTETANLSAPPTSAFAPSDIRHAYGFDKLTNQGAGQTIAIVDAYDDANIEADLAVFSKQFALPACTTADGCFLKVYASGSRPSANANWAMEAALDVEWAHAIAPQAKIVLVEAKSYALSDLLTGVDVAVRHGASVVSMSWTSAEFSGERNLDTHFASTGITFVAASGDSGNGVNYPAASPDVVSVGGTSLILDQNKNYKSETAWSGSGGGLSAYENEPLYQSQFGVPDNSRGARAVPDVSYNANPGTGYAIYNSIGLNGASGWFQVGGTSAATPQWAAAIAISNAMRAAQRKANLSAVHSALYAATAAAASTSRLAHTDYELSLERSIAAAAGNFFPVITGSNGSCGQICDASAGYDYVSGLGTPRVTSLVPALVARL